MNLSRRSFLKALAAIPAIAAMPFTVEALAIEEEAAPLQDSLPLEEPTAQPRFGGRGRLWLSINGKPIDSVTSIALDQRPQYIDVTNFGEQKTEFKYGLNDPILTINWLFNASEGEFEAFDALKNQLPARVVAEFPEIDSRLVLDGFFTKWELNDNGPGGLITACAAVEFAQARWEAM